MTDKQFDNTNRGAIWRNDKADGPNDPDFTGKLDVEGRQYRVSAWRRKDGEPSNTPALRFSIKPIDAPATAKTKPKAKAEFNDEIGF